VSRFLDDQHNRTGYSSDLIREQYSDLLSRTLKPGVRIDLPGSAEWARLPDDLKNTAVICAAMWWVDEQNARIDHLAEMDDLLDQIAQLDEALNRLIERRASIAVSLAQEWGRHRPTFAQLEAYRNSHPDARPVDPEAVRRWVETGSSTHRLAPTAPTEAKGTNAA